MSGGWRYATGLAAAADDPRATAIAHVLDRQTDASAGLTVAVCHDPALLDRPAIEATMGAAVAAADGRDGDAVLALVVRQETRAGELAAEVRRLALEAAPALRVNAVLGGTPDDIAATLGLFAGCRSMTGQTVKLDAPADTGTEATPGLRRERVIVRDLVLDAAIGAYRHERDRRQPLRINLALDVDPPAAAGHARPDRLDQAVDYDRIVQGIRVMLDAGHVQLVETVAERIAALCLADPRVCRAIVRVEKPAIYAEAAAAGVEIERWRGPA